MKIAIGSDHAGFELKQIVRDHLVNQGHQVVDHGTLTMESVDYPDIAVKVAQDVSDHKAEFGVLVCGSGIGMAITANKVRGIRSANISSEYEAQMSREHNDANVIAIGARILQQDLANTIVDKFLATSFAHGRHSQRVEKITAVEQSQQQNN
jgi:ribose 5-phosphate isomerase B